MGSGGYSIPSIVEPEELEFVKCDAKFVLHVEKDTVWRRFNEDKFWREHNCILTHGGGQPPRGVRRLLHRLHDELKLPIYCLLDNDPWGYYIYSVLKQGSINLAYESKRMAIPDARYIGLRSKDYERCGLTPSVIINLNDTDVKRAKQIAQYPWFENKKAWQKEIELMLKNGFKLEVEALINKGISYVTETYVPERLAEGDFLDEASEARLFRKSRASSQSCARLPGAANFVLLVPDFCFSAFSYDGLPVPDGMAFRPTLVAAKGRVGLPGAGYPSAGGDGGRDTRRRRWLRVKRGRRILRTRTRIGSRLRLGLGFASARRHLGSWSACGVLGEVRFQSASRAQANPPRIKLLTFGLVQMSSRWPKDV